MDNSTNNNQVLGIRGNTAYVRRDETSNKEYPVTYASRTNGRGDMIQLSSTNMTYNPSTDTLTVGDVTGVASQVKIQNINDDTTYSITAIAEDPTPGNVDATLCADRSFTARIRSTGPQNLEVRSDDSGLALYKTPTISDNGYRLRYVTADDKFYISKVDSDVDTDVITINSSANVGIGTTPSYKFHIDTTGDNYGLVHSSGTVEIASYISGGTNAYIGTKSNHKLFIMANDSAKMTIDTSGNVGVGVVPSVAKFEAEDSANGKIEYVKGTNASYTSTASIIDVTRAATSAYNFLVTYSNGATDIEHNLRGDGNAYCDGSWNGGGADYAEYFESATGVEIPLGKCVVIEYDETSSVSLIREYDETVDKLEDIIGVVRPKNNCRSSSFIGNNHWGKWKEKYLLNEWGEYELEDYECVEFVDKDGKEQSYECDKIPEFEEEPDKDGKEVPFVVPDDAKRVTLKRKKLNPLYDENLEYIPYEDRDEKVLIGLVGQVPKLKSEPLHPNWRRCHSVSESVEMVYIR
jgi:hypothetical protein